MNFLKASIALAAPSRYFVSPIALHKCEYTKGD
jgi:hypothetical protein